MRTPKILVADDAESSARYLKRLLIHEGHHVAVVSTVRALVDTFANLITASPA
jgi:CheY-like chemotaxis protein